jgi:hypothetical protein
MNIILISFWQIWIENLGELIKMNKVFDNISIIFTVLSIIGGFLVASRLEKRRHIAFILWLIANLGWIVFNIYYKHYYPIVMYVFYFVQAVIGFFNTRSKNENKCKS